MTDQAKYHEKIKTALAQLDHDDADSWTEDGLPRTGIVQKLLNDQTIRRQDIGDAWPGFVRKVSVTAPIEPTATDPGPKADGGTTLVDPIEPIAPVDTRPTEAEYRAKLNQDVVDAEMAYIANKKELAVCHGREQPLRLEIERTKKVRAAAFPPMTAAQNIKEYLAGEHQKRIETSRLNQVDAAMGKGNTLGWKRPVRPMIGVDGNVVMPIARDKIRRTG
jgi:hypothetical protein